VIDGEIVLPDFAAGRLDFEALQLRLHPAASRVKLLAEQTPAHFVAFDLLASMPTTTPAPVRRAPAGARTGTGRAPVAGPPDAGDHDREVPPGWFTQFEGAGLDGLIAKSRSVTYERTSG
jgi:bifunctional non-homologous end joining protein LigD